MSRPDHPSGARDRQVHGAPDAVPGAPTPCADPRIRPARPADVPEILALVRALAEHVGSAHEVQASEGLLTDLLFGDGAPSGGPGAFCHVVDASAPVAGPGGLDGFALWFLTTSTWTGRHGIHLEDLYVRPRARGQGLGRALMAELATLCCRRGYARLEWSVLDWNTPALDFYRSLGARAMAESTVQRITGDDLRRLAHGVPTGLPGRR